MFTQKLIAIASLASALFLGTAADVSAHPRRGAVVVVAPAPTPVVVAPAAAPVTAQGTKTLNAFRESDYWLLLIGVELVFVLECGR